MPIEPNISGQGHRQDYLDTVVAEYEALQETVRQLALDATTLATEVERLKTMLQRDSVNLTNLSWVPVYEAKLVCAGGGTTTPGEVFDISQQSKDSAGNLVIPHAFYLISAFCPDLNSGVAAGPCSVVYQGTPIIINDISIYIERTAVATPTRFESRIQVHKVTALNTDEVDVHIKVLKLLGAR